MPEASILIVDDSDSDVMLERFAFEQIKFPYRIDRAVDGIAALEQLAARSGKSDLPAVMLLDVKMPRLSGLEMLERVRADPAYSGIYIIVFSSSDEPHDVAEAERLGANLYLQKPSTLSELEDMARWVLRIVEARPAKGQKAS